MLKRKFTIIALIVAIIMTLMVPIVRAEDQPVDANSGNNPELISTEGETDKNAAPSEDNFKKGDVYLAGDTVTIDYIVDGNVFVVANELNINSQIGGDVFAIANKINVSEQGYVFSNLFTISNELTISGVVYDLYTSSNNITVNGYIYRDIKAIASTLNINGIVGRNAFVEVGNLNFATPTADNNNKITAQGMVNGDLNYTSKSELKIPEGSVSGKTNFTKANEIATASISTYILNLGTFLATVAIIWALASWFAPKFLNRVNNITAKKLLPAFGFGLLTPIVFGLIFIVLLLLSITSTVALLSLSVLMLLIALGSTFFAIALNQMVCRKLHITNNIGTFGLLILTSIILWLLELIPVAGPIITMIVSVTGLGILVMSILSKKEPVVEVEKADSSKKEETKKIKAETKTEKKSKKETDKKVEKTTKKTADKTDKTAKKGTKKEDKKADNKKEESKKEDK